MKELVVGIDPGKKTGIVALELNGKQCKVISQKLIAQHGKLRDDKYHLKAETVQSLTLAIVNHVEELVTGYGGPVTIAIEEPFIGRNANTALHAIYAVTVVHLSALGRRLMVLWPQNLKQFIGQTQKHLIVQEVKTRWGFESPSNDLVDAYVIARWAAENQKG